MFSEPFGSVWKVVYVFFTNQKCWKYAYDGFNFYKLKMTDRRWSPVYKPKSSKNIKLWFFLLAKNPWESMDTFLEAKKL